MESDMEYHRFQTSLNMSYYNIQRNKMKLIGKAVRQMKDRVYQLSCMIVFELMMVEQRCFCSLVDNSNALLYTDTGSSRL